MDEIDKKSKKFDISDSMYIFDGYFGFLFLGFLYCSVCFSFWLVCLLGVVVYCVWNDLETLCIVFKLVWLKLN